MYYKLFPLNKNTDQKIEKLGFTIKSYINENVYNGTTVEFSIKIPKDYIYDGSVWQKIDSSLIDEKTCCLIRMPRQSFPKLWDLFINSNIEDDRLGALVTMNEIYYLQLSKNQKELYNKKHLASKEKRAKKLLSTYLFREYKRFSCK